MAKACATSLADGMVIATDTKALREHRKETLALLTSIHFGDCKAPCNLTCPGQINVQGYIAHVAKGEYEEALRLVMERNPVPVFRRPGLPAFLRDPLPAHPGRRTGLHQSPETFCRRLVHEPTRSTCGSRRSRPPAKK